MRTAEHQESASGSGDSGVSEIRQSARKMIGMTCDIADFILVDVAGEGLRRIGSATRRLIKKILD